jgi:rhamnosyltransferase
MIHKLAAIIVTFHPEVDRLARQLDVLKADVDEIIIVDNGSAKELHSILTSPTDDKQISFLPLGSNFGIAYAQNRGIEIAKAHGHNKVLFLDQDSVPAQGMIVALDNALEKLLGDGIQVGAVVPSRDDENDDSPTTFLRFDRFPPREFRCSLDCPLPEADIVISSGMLIPIELFEIVGPVEERLFIDQVETEWCFRARSINYRFFGVCNARLSHKLGGRLSRFWLGRWRVSAIHVPTRNYYFVRNSLTLLRRNYCPINWKWYISWILVKYLIRNIFTSPRIDRMRMMMLGIAHAFIGRLGRMQQYEAKHGP